MKSIIIESTQDKKISDKELEKILDRFINNINTGYRKILLLPPDNTRGQSKANYITRYLYKIFKSKCQIDIMPALGTHLPMTNKELVDFFGKTIPLERFIVHNWRDDVVKIGEISEQDVRSITGGIYKNLIDVEVNKRIVDGSYDLIISIGQVVPHELTGMANYSKNIFVGCGGFNMINQSHILGPICGAENTVGEIDTPVRKVFDYAHYRYLSNIPLMFILTVTTFYNNSISLEGIYIGNKREIFEKAAHNSKKKNITYLKKPVNKVVAYLDEDEFKTTWLGDKAIHRTRNIIKDGGELIIIAPGIRQFGDDKEVDTLIRKYGYIGKEKLLKLLDNNDLKNNLSAAGQLMLSSSNGRYKIIYAVKHLSKSEVEGVNFSYISYDDAVKKYNPSKLNDGFNIVDGEVIYFVRYPGLGFWTLDK